MKLTFFILSEIGTSIYYLFLFLVLTMESTTSLPITQEIFLKKKKSIIVGPFGYNLFC